MRFRSSVWLTAMVIGLPTLGTAQSGDVIEIEVEAPSLAGNRIGEGPARAALVYLPDGYHAAEGRRYPVVYLLHAFGSGPESWRGVNGYEDMDLAAVLDSLIAVGSIPPLLVVMPDARTRYGGSWYASSPTIGDWERFIGVDLIAAIDGRFATSARAGQRALVGQSMGAYGALRVASGNPGVFGTVVAVSGPSLVDPNPLGIGALRAALQVDSPTDLPNASPLSAVLWSKAAAFTPDPNGPFFARLPAETAGNEVHLVPGLWERWQQNTIRGLLAETARQRALREARVRLDVGKGDPVRAETLALAQAFDSLHVSATVVEFPGGHVEGVRAHLTHSVLPFLGRRLAPQPLALPTWMSGCWERRAGERSTGEDWTPAFGNTLFGLSHTMVGDELRAWELLRIGPGEDGLTYYALPSGQALTAFPAVQAGADSITFENPEHDFPQRLRYFRIARDSLGVRAETLDGARGFEIRWGRRDCPP